MRRIPSAFNSGEIPDGELSFLLVNLKKAPKLLVSRIFFSFSRS